MVLGLWLRCDGLYYNARGKVVGDFVFCVVLFGFLWPLKILFLSVVVFPDGRWQCDQNIQILEYEYIHIRILKYEYILIF